MKKTFFFLMSTSFILAGAVLAEGTNYFVSLGNPGHEHPFTNWAMAADNIPDVIALARDGDTITVANETYPVAATIELQYGIIFQSADISAPELTVLDGGGAAIHGITINHTNAVVRGFTIKDFGAGAANYGAQVLAGQLTDCVVTGCYDGVLTSGPADTVNLVSNCTITASTRYGIMISGTNILVTNSRITGNSSIGIFIGNHAKGIFIENCQVASNTSSGIEVRMYTEVEINGSDIIGNTRNAHGAGIYMLYAEGASVVMNRCRILHNQSTGGNFRGAGIYSSSGSPAPELTIRNSLVAYNYAQQHGGGIYSVNKFTIENCTITSNRAGANSAGGIYYTVGASGTVVNSTVYFNEPYNWVTFGEDNVSFLNVCTPAGEPAGVVIENHITTEPGFVDFDAGDFRLTRNSPCVNAGKHIPEIGQKDLDGRTRIDRFSGVIDVGCYEYISQGTLYHVH